MSYICMVVDGEYSKDIRVIKEAEALQNSGEKVLVICPKKSNLNTEEIINGVKVFRIGNNYSFSKKGIYDIVESITNINFFFYFGLKKAFKKYDIQFLHIHDLPLAGTGFKFRNKVKKTVLDLHENYPEAIKTWFQWKKNPVIRLKNKIFFNPNKWSKKEQKYCRKYDKVICVVEEMKQKLIDKFSIKEDKFLVVSNQELKSFSENYKTKINSLVISKEDFSITYVGGLGPHRGIDTAILGMKNIVNHIPEAKLYIVGSGSKDVVSYLQNLVTLNKLENLVKLVGQKPFNEVSSIMMNSNVNIIPHKANDHTNNTIPHKLFQIMMSKSLLLVSSCKPLKRIVEKYNAGLVFRAEDEEDFAEKIIDIHRNFKSYKIKTENAFEAVVNGNENWNTESKKLINLYNNLTN